jgi:hypothetical protein
MSNNKITLGVRKQDKTDKTQRISMDEEFNNLPVSPVEQEQKKEQKSADDSVWGNDTLLDRQLSKEHLDEKRRYTRVRHVQRIECRTIIENINTEYITLNKPIILTLSDISMGGIGAVSDQELKTGSILEFDINLDHLKYNIQCEIIYCVSMDESFRIGLSFAKKDKDFVKHLKILVARISLQSSYQNKT